MPLKNKLAIISVALIALLAGYWLASTQVNNRIASPDSTTTLIQGVVINPPRKVGLPELYKDDGQTLTSTDMKGHWSLLFFGYTNCPDVCPTTLHVLAQTKKKAEKSANALSFPSVYFISVDPARDKTGVLAEYVDYFDKDFTGIAGEESMIKALTLQLSAVYIIMPPEDATRPDNYIVDHSSALYLLNPDGKLVAMFNPPFTTQTLLKDIKTVIAR